MVKTKLIAIAILAILLSDCGGGGGGGDSSQPPLPLTPVHVTITRAANGCLVSDNADAEVAYTLGGHQAKTLLWSCANIGMQSAIGAEAFYTLDSTLQCFVEQSVISKAGDCSMRATAPPSPVLAASIRTINAPTLNNIGSGLYALNLDAEVTITDNLSSFGPSIRVSSLPSHFAALDSIGNTPISGASFIQALTPACAGDPTSLQACSEQKVMHVFQPILSNSTTAGQQYAFTLTVLDFFGNAIGSTGFNLTAP